MPDFGFVSSPLVDGDHLYVQAANSLVKLDKTTGETVWRALANDGNIMRSGAFSSPVLATLAGRRQLVVQTRDDLNGVDPETGDVLWSQPVPSFRGMNILTPTVHGDRILTSTYRHNTFLYEIADGPEGLEPTLLWTHKSPGYMSSPVIIDGHAYLHLGSGRLICLDLATGVERWVSEPFGKYWSMIGQGDKMLALNDLGELYLIAANPERLELLDRSQIADSSTYAHLAVLGDDLVVRDLEGVAAYRWAGDGAGARQPRPRRRQARPDGRAANSLETVRRTVAPAPPAGTVRRPAAALSELQSGAGEGLAMCRYAAYLGPPLVLSELIYKPTNSLVHQAKEAMQSSTRINADGFGVGLVRARDLRRAGGLQGHQPDVEQPQPGLDRRQDPRHLPRRPRPLGPVLRPGDARELPPVPARPAAVDAQRRHPRPRPPEPSGRHGGRRHAAGPDPRQHRHRVGVHPVPDQPGGMARRAADPRSSWPRRCARPCRRSPAGTARRPTRGSWR